MISEDDIKDEVNLFMVAVTILTSSFITLPEINVIFLIGS